MHEFTQTLMQPGNSLYSTNSLLYRWLHGEPFSFEAISELFALWMIVGTVCLAMLVCGIGFLIGRRIRRGLVSIFSGVFYAVPLITTILCDPQTVLDNAAVATFLVAILWFFIANCLLYKMHFFARVIASYVHFLLLMFPGLIAADSSPTAALMTVWGIAVAFHLFVFCIPFLPDTGGDEGFSLNDMIGDEYDDWYVDGI